MVLSIEFEPPRESEPCQCCGGRTTSLTRFVYKDADAYVVYFARFSDNHAARVVKALVSIGEWGEGSGPEQRVAFALEMRTGAENYEVRVCDAVESPWYGEAFLGPALDRGLALDHPLIREAIYITDHVVLEDGPLKAYLDSPA